MVWIPGGTFQMGDEFGDGSSYEKPVHTVTVGDFYLGATEVTVAQWRNYVNDSGISFDWSRNSAGDYPVAKYSPEEDCPIINVTWVQALVYCHWLSQKTGDHYRLPTEAEWEYAARSGGKKEKWAGTSSESSLGSYAWYTSNSGSTTHPVGQKQPNELGLYDMNGNVWEWCSDWYGSYPSGSVTNPTVPSSGANRAICGGSWNNGAGRLRCAFRYDLSPADRYHDIGFRLAKTHLPNP
jgi:formylglycine-generating enzyme required for sulfatase activity